MPNVVIVPGILGSELGFDNGTKQPTVVWRNTFYLRGSGPGVLQLATDGEEPGPLAHGTHVSPTGKLVAASDYTAMAARLQSEGWAVDTFPFDWRKTLESNAAALATFLLSKYAGKDYYVLAYSMGGLVSRLAYGSVVAAGGQARWKRTVHVGVPHFGSHYAAIYLANPDQNNQLTGSYGKLLEGLGLPQGVVDFLSIYLAATKASVGSWPGLYGLLPSIAGGWVTTRPLDPRLYLASSYAPTNSNVTQAWLTAALATRTAIDNTLTAPQPPQRCVVGAGTDTPDRLERTTSISKPTDYATADGDGAVTVARGTLPGAPAALVLDGALHSNLFGDGRLLQRVTGLLRFDDFPSVDVLPFKQEVVYETQPPLLLTIPGPPFSALQRRNDP